MEYRAVIKKTGRWWVGWLIDLPGVNAQERSRKKLIESLRVGARELLKLQPEVPEGATVETILV